MRAAALKRPLSTTLLVLALWLIFYASFTLWTPALLDDADSVHAEVAREMLLRHDYVTLYANGIRYLEKAPLLYWAMAACMRVTQLLGHSGPRALAAAARVPLALTVLALALAVESFARRAFRSTRAGLAAALILLSSPGVFLFTRTTLPDATLCLWMTLALYCFWLTEQSASAATSRERETDGTRLLSCGIGASCALGVLTKGMIGVVFPVAVVVVYLLLTRGLRGAVRRLRELHPLASSAVFLAFAAPWHVLAALRNPARGAPGAIAWVHGHLAVPMPTPGNVHGWAWFYFVNEQVLRYLNARVPRDYDTVPLWLFWGLCLVWLMPWSAFVFHAAAAALPVRTRAWRDRLRMLALTQDERTLLLLTVAAAVPLLFFSLSTRQEYYVLPSLPAAAMLIAAWLAEPARKAALRGTAVLAAAGAVFAAAALFLIVHSGGNASNLDLATLLQQNPGDYAMSMGHFLDLNAQALGLFRIPLAIAAASLLLGPLAAYLLYRAARPHAAELALAAGAFGFLLAAHLGLQTFAPVLSSAQLAETIRPQIAADDLVVIHQEYEFGSTLGFYLQRPGYSADGARRALNPIHILTQPGYNGTSEYGRSSNLWYGSFFPDAPSIFESAGALAARWHGPQRIWLWQDLANQPAPLPAALTPAYVIARSGGKEIVSNQPNR